MKKMEILMVEDNRGDVVLMQEAILSAALPCTISVAHDGVEAMAVLRRQGNCPDAAAPDLILLDLKLPRKTGIEVLNDIQLDPSLRHIPLVVVSSSPSELIKARALRDPPCVCMVKPGTFEGYVELARTIGEFLETGLKEEIS